MHTSGPWGCFYTSNHAHDYRLTKPDGSPLPVNAPANDHSEQRNNARLIAAAPDMLAALQALVDAIDFEGENGRIRFNPGTVYELDQLRSARAAITKATGTAA